MSEYEIAQIAIQLWREGYDDKTGEKLGYKDCVKTVKRSHGIIDLAEKGKDVPEEEVSQEACAAYAASEQLSIAIANIISYADKIISESERKITKPGDRVLFSCSLTKGAAGDWITHNVELSVE
jgi:hypothetical protein